MHAVDQFHMQEWAMRERAMICIMALSMTLVSCGEGQKKVSVQKEAIDVVNAPEGLIGAGTLERQLTALVASSRVTNVWTGDYWPDSAGGTARRKQAYEMSPMEKYDAVTNQQGLATRWEREDAARNGSTSWSGHCNGVTAAGIRTAAPQHSVVYRGVEFSVDDVKALLAEAYMGNGRLVGRRCDRTRISVDPMGRPIDLDCRDLNPASFHLALTNFLGAHHLPVIIDLSLDHQVWNYVVTGYRTQVRRVSEDEAKSLVFAHNGRPYPFNPLARSFAAVLTEVELLLVGARRNTFEYLLELDNQDAIIGGEWLGSSRLNHPDFIWRPERTPRPLNPHLDAAVIREIYQASIQ